MVRPGTAEVAEVSAMIRQYTRHAADTLKALEFTMATDLICEGCGQDIDPTICRHEWSDEDDKSTTYYHADCCPALHVTNGDCGEIDDE
jgi:hypothetical protein